MGKPFKATVLYLTGDSEAEFDNFRRSLTLLQRNFLSRFPYPVIVFHEKTYPHDYRRAITEILPEIRWVEVHFSLPKFLDLSMIPESIPGPGREFRYGYRHMCRFFSGLIYRETILAEFDYYWRLDTDSFLPKPVQYDLFEFMHQRDLKYGYNYCIPDHPDFIIGLWEETKRFLDKKQIQPKFLDRFMKDGAWDGHCFYSNFEIASLHFFRSPEYMAFFDHLDHSGGIYRYRWGDAPIHLLGVSLFLEEKQTHMFRDVDYVHALLRVSSRKGISSFLGVGNAPPGVTLKRWRTWDVIWFMMKLPFYKAKMFIKSLIPQPQ